MNVPPSPAAAASDAPAARVRGVAEPLPPGERVLWEGAPTRALVARHVLHARLVTAYFVATTAWWASRTVPDVGLREALPLLVVQLALGGLVLALVHTYAAMVARTTAYTVTTRRVVLRVGAVLPVVVNVPFTIVLAAGLHRFRDGSGQIALTLDRTARVSFWLLWPHVRPWRLRYPEPLLRGLADPDAAGRALAEAAELALGAAPPASGAPEQHVGDAPRHLAAA